ncbi:MAG: hypothetical protein GXP24_06225 [Planctomycetes bacterium]|nr:hypothetical protein [Planctomycetota bacterium]
MTQRIPCAVFSVLLCVTVAGGCNNSKPEATSEKSPEAATTPAATQSNLAPSEEDHPAPITAEDVERPASFRDAIPRIISYRDNIRGFIDAGKPHSTHVPLDELDFVLSWLPELAQEDNIPRTFWEPINTTAQEIRELFNKVHARLDAEEEANYGEVAEDVDKAIRRLQQIADDNS